MLLSLRLEEEVMSSKKSFFLYTHDRELGVQIHYDFLTFK